MALLYPIWELEYFELNDRPGILIFFFHAIQYVILKRNDLWRFLVVFFFQCRCFIHHKTNIFEIYSQKVFWKRIQKMNITNPPSSLKRARFANNSSMRTFMFFDWAHKRTRKREPRFSEWTDSTLTLLQVRSRRCCLLRLYVHIHMRYCK